MDLDRLAFNCIPHDKDHLCSLSELGNLVKEVEDFISNNLYPLDLLGVKLKLSRDYKIIMKYDLEVVLSDLQKTEHLLSIRDKFNKVFSSELLRLTENLGLRLQLKKVKIIKVNESLPKGHNKHSYEAFVYRLLVKKIF